MKKLTYILILCFVFLFFSNCWASASGLVIDEFRTRGASAQDEYIVLANYGNLSINLQSYFLYKKTASGANYALLKFPPMTLNAGGKIIVAGKDYTGSKNFIYSTNNSLADSNNAIIVEDSSKNIIDSVTYGTVSFNQQEGTALPNPESGVPYKRINGKDTDNNLADFQPVKAVAAYDPYIVKVMLTEMMPDPKTGDEWLEIYNPVSVTVNLSGLSVCDKLGSVHCYKFNDTIGPFSYKIYDSSKTRISLNNDGDILELKDPQGIVISTSRSSYGKSTEECSFALFGSEWKWTKVPTKGRANVLSAVTTNKKATKKTASKQKPSSSVKGPSYRTLSSNEGEDLIDDTGDEVKGSAKEVVSKISKKEVGFALIVLAIITVIGYTIYENREKIDDLYHKVLRRNN